MLNATIKACHASLEVWDAIVIGSGPAGAFLASGLARENCRTLLVEAKQFPREKVCGGCLNTRALSLLNNHGLVEDLPSAGAIELNSLRLVCRGRDHRWPTSGSVAIRRSTLDSILARTAIASGAEFLPGTKAIVSHEPVNEFRYVDLQSTDQSVVRAAARVVICADGLNHSSLVRDDRFASRIATDSRIGLQATFPVKDHCYPAGELTMAVGSGGYVGITVVDNGFINIAAAIDPQQLSRHDGAEAFIFGILDKNQLPIPENYAKIQFTGTPPLTRTRQSISASRLFVIGDAAGYIEPFTGEGMAWALASAQAVLPLAVQATRFWGEELEAAWMRLFKRKVLNQQWTCHLLSRLLRQPRLASLTLDLCHLLPPLRRAAMAQVGGHPTRRKLKRERAVSHG